MVHRLSKQAVVKTNRKNIELDLTWRTNVLQAIWYLIDGGTDDRFNELDVGDGLKSIITNWYMTEDLYPEDVAEEGIFRY